MRAIAYLGFRRSTEVQVKITRQEAAAGIALVTCFECLGSGKWPFGPEDDGIVKPSSPDCIVCKGTGRYAINA